MQKTALISDKFFLKICFFVLFTFFASQLYSQEDKTGQQAIEDLIEEIAQNRKGEADYSQITDNLYYFLNNPVNINTASVETLEKLYLLNDFQIKSLRDYIKKHGALVTIYELQLIDGFDYSTIKKLLPFITVSDGKKQEPFSFKKAVKYGNHSVFGRVSSIIETPQGFTGVEDSVYKINPDRYYKGNRLRVYSRYKFNYKNRILWGITAEKDPGEQFFAGKQSTGFDFYSAHFQINDIGILKTAVVGDYQVNIGQGLMMWSYMATDKSSYVMDIRKRGQGLRKYSSTDENAFLRGGGVTVSKGDFSLSVFGSYKKIDANTTVIDTVNNRLVFTSFLNSGIHAVPTEQNNEKSVTETLYGANVNWRHNNFKIGMSGVKYQFNIPFQPANSLINKFRFSGDKNYNLSTDFEYRLKSIFFFGEVAMSENKGKALLAGALFELASQLRASVLYRNYQSNYQALYANAFAEGSRTQNEEGFYLGAEIFPVRKWKISGYYDFFKFPWLKTGAYAPSKGDDYLIQADFTVSRNVSMYWRYKNETKEVNFAVDNENIIKLTPATKSMLRYHLQYSPAENWELRNRIELSGFDKDSVNEKGFMVYQDIIYRPDKYPLAVVFRYAVFNTDSYNTRIYTYENDVLNAYSVPPLYGKGTRTYLMVNYSINSKVTFWLRFSQTWFADRDEIGSGLNTIEGNTKSEIKFQVRIKI